ncbi:MAG: right-handed parallel beta-helix repeat-containing protein, partial [Armatimonadota bacterium]
MVRASLLLAVCLLLATGVCAAADLYVAPSGNDLNPGTAKLPLATLQRAREVVRTLRQAGDLPAGGVRVILRQGTYYLPMTLELDKQDGGTASSPITYCSYGQEQAWLNGGRPVPAQAWKPVSAAAVLARMDPVARGKVLQADLSALGIAPDVAELPDAFRGFTNNNPVLAEVFCNGQRMTLARWPNTGFAHFGDIVDPGPGLRDPNGPKRLARFKFEDPRLQRWNVDEGVWMSGYWARAYLNECVRAGAIDKQKQEIQWAYPLGYGLDTAGANRFYVFNVLGELDSPGEYFLDRKTQLLYFWPPQPIAQCTTSVSCLATPLVSLQGCDYVAFKRVGFEGGRQTAVVMSNCSHNRLLGCTIRGMGMDGVVVTGGADVGVQGCDIHDMGAAGVKLSGGDRATLTPCNHFADNNHIYNTSVIRRTHAGPISLQGVGLRAAHNLIHHEPHTAVWYGGNDIVMEYNEIYTVLTDTTEGGVFYAGYDWTMRGNVIRYNYIHHINDVMEGCGSEAVVVHEDDCVSGTEFTGNLCYLTGNGCVMCGGPDNTAQNNLFVKCKTGAMIEGRGLDWWQWTKHPDGSVTAVDTRNGATTNNLLRSLTKVPYQSGPWLKYPHLADILQRDPAGAPYFCSITRNIAVEGKCAWVQGNVKPEWVTVEDNWDNEGDPGFVGLPKEPVRATDFRLRSDAVAIRKIGFKPLPLEQMGLVNDGTRATWPVKAEPPPAGFRPHWLLLKEQALKAPSALPILRVPRSSGKVVIDGVVNLEEWAQSPPQAAGMPVVPIDSTPVPWNYDGKKAPWPTTAWLNVDDQNLYVAFVNDVDPAKGVSGGQVWGKDDAVEIAIAPLVDKKLGDTLIWRGYSNGFFTTSDEAGTKTSLVKRALQGVSYACQVTGTSRWSAEWKIPFAALSIDPAKRNPQLLFNLSVRKPAGDLWVMWKKGGGFTWEVKNGGLLWLEPFGDITLSGAIPSQPLLYTFSVTPGLTMKPGQNCFAPNWANPVGSRLVTSAPNLIDAKWHSFEFTFTPDRDG